MRKSLRVVNPTSPPGVGPVLRFRFGQRRAVIFDEAENRLQVQ